jgi:hypothetical protein
MFRLAAAASSAVWFFSFALVTHDVAEAQAPPSKQAIGCRLGSSEAYRICLAEKANSIDFCLNAARRAYDECEHG